MPPRIRLSPQTLLVLEAFLLRPGAWRYGYDLSRDTGLKSGTLYLILMRLAEPGLLETRWEAADPGRPPRHMYRLTHKGTHFARETVKSAASRKSLPRPAFGES